MFKDGSPCILKIDYDDLDSQKIKYKIQKLYRKHQISKTKFNNKGPNYQNFKIFELVLNDFVV